MPRHYLNQCWIILNWTLRNNLQWNLNRPSNISIQENAFESVVCETVAILCLVTVEQSNSLLLLYPACLQPSQHTMVCFVHVYLKDGISRLNMMTSSNGNIFRVTGLLCGEFTGYRWIPLTKAIDAEHWCFLWSAPEKTVEYTIVRPLKTCAILVCTNKMRCKYIFTFIKKNPFVNSFDAGTGISRENCVNNISADAFANMKECFNYQHHFTF